MSEGERLFVAVTGAQGVGKSTFCRSLCSRLAGAGRSDVTLLDGLGERIKALGIPLGSASDPRTIAAVFTAHLEREAAAPPGIILLDRCVVDALAYTRTLAVGTEVDRRLFECVAALASKRLGLVLHLSLSPFFSDRGAGHETPELRFAVARGIGPILDELGLRHTEFDAACNGAVERAAETVLGSLDAI